MVGRPSNGGRGGRFVISVAPLSSQWAVTGAFVRWVQPPGSGSETSPRAWVPALVQRDDRRAMTQTSTPPATCDAAAASIAYRSALDVIAAVEPNVADAVRQELTDQRTSLKLIASENYASPAVLLTMGSWL